MSRIKNEFFEEINDADNYEPVYEPYIFKYSVYFHYNGQPHTIMADSFEDIETIAKSMIPMFKCLAEDTRELGYVFDCDDWILPVRLFENQNVIYK